jgi:hypothetical protein
MKPAASVIHTWSFITAVDVVDSDTVKRVWEMEESSKTSTVQLLNRIQEGFYTPHACPVAGPPVTTILKTTALLYE